MKKARRKGLSFLELVIAMTLTFLTITFLMGLFVTSIRNGERSKKRTRASLMAQSTLERLSAFTADQIGATHANFDPPMQDYCYDIDVQPAGDYSGTGDDPDLKQIICTVTDPAGNRSTLVALRQQATPLYGLAVSRVTDELVFSQDPLKYSPSASRPIPVSCLNTTDPAVTGGDQSYIDWYPSTNFLEVAGNPTMPGNGQVGAICSNLDLTSLCAVDLTGRGIRFISSGTSTWGSLATPTGLGHPSGITGKVDAGGNSRIFLGDDKNRCIWEYKQNTNSWNGPLAAPGTGRIASIGCDDGVSVVWAIDVTAKGLRRYDANAGTWSASVYAPSDPTFPSIGELVGLAVSGNGKKVFMCDEQTLYILDTLSNTWTVPPSVSGCGGMPSKLVSDIPQALATNTDGSRLWANPAFGSLYYYDVSNDYWYENYIP